MDTEKSNSKYARLVEAAQKNAKTVWVVADELLKVCPNRSRQEIDAAHTALIDAGYEYTPERLKVLALTAERWPQDKRCLEASFKAHEVLNAREDRAELIHPNMTLTEAHRAAGHSTAARTFVGDGGPGPEAIAAAAEDEGAIRSLVDNEKFRRSFLKEHTRQMTQAEDNEQQAQRSRAPGLAREHAVLTAASKFDSAAFALRKGLDALRDETLTDGERERLASHLDRVEQVLGLVRTSVESSDAKFDEQLTALLSEGA